MASARAAGHGMAIGVPRMDGGVLRGMVLTVLVLLPVGVRAADPEAAYEERFGTEAERVRLSKDRDDDATFAAKLLQAADNLQDDRPMRVLLYEKAYWFGVKGPKGRKTAIEATQRLSELVPEERDDWQEKALMADFLLVEETKDKGAARKVLRKLVDRVVALADAHARAGKYARAANLYRGALKGASRIDPDRKDAILAKLKAISPQAEVDERIQQLKRRLKAEPGNQAAAAALLRLYLVDLDKPEAAAEYAELGAKDETEKRLVLVAGMHLERLPEKALLTLGDWYKDLAAGAGPARPAMLRRAKTYYERYLARCTEEDESRLPVQAKLDQVTEDLGP